MEIGLLNLPKPFTMEGKVYYAHAVRLSYGKTFVVMYHKEKDLNHISDDSWVQQAVCGMTYLHCIQWLE